MGKGFVCLAAGSDAYDFATSLRLVASNRPQGWDSVLSLDREAFLAAPTARHAVEHLDDVLQGLPHAILREGNWMLSVPPVGENGFAIDVTKSSPVVRVFFGAFEQEFDTLKTALRWVERALSSSFQLRIISIGSKPSEFRLEPFGAEHAREAPLLGEDVLVGGYVQFSGALFRKATTVIKRNGFPPG